MIEKRQLVIIAIFLAIAGGIFGIYTLFNDGNNKEKNSISQQQVVTGDARAAQPEAQSGNVAATISNFKYEPSLIKVKKGSTVTWTNSDDVQHDVTSDSDSELRGLNSDLLDKGESYSFIFAEAGIYTYHSRPYPYVVGAVEVVE